MQQINRIQSLFQSRLATLEHLLKVAQSYFGDDESYLQKRIAADMLPLGTQIVFTCNQPRNFALWCDGQPVNNLDPQVNSLAQAREHIANTVAQLDAIHAEETNLAEITTIELGHNLYLELSGDNYVHEFLLPNFYFHLVTAYDILRMAGVPIGKRDYMTHIVPHLKTHS